MDTSSSTAPARHQLPISRWETDGGHIEEPVDEARHAQAEHVRRQTVAVAERLCREFAPEGGTAAESSAIRSATPATTPSAHPG